MTMIDDPGTLPPALTDTAAAILAGGRSRRMSGRRKALLDLAGKPLLQHVIERSRPQAACLFLSVDVVSEDFERFALPQVADLLPGSRGPLGGLAAALHVAAGAGMDWLLLLPCDAPFVPPDLAVGLRSRALESGRTVAVVRQGGRVHPTFSLWRADLADEVEAAVRDTGMAGFMEFLQGRPCAELVWPDRDRAAFFNINDPPALAEAVNMLRGKQVEQT